jgi:histidinol-phosphatase (PHP family)
MAFDKTAADISRKLCQAANQQHLPIEYNLKGLGRKEVPGALGYPCEEFWRIAAEENCTAVIGADAHTPQALTGPQWEQAQDFLGKLGIPVLEDPTVLLKNSCANAKNALK